MGALDGVAEQPDLKPEEKKTVRRSSSFSRRKGKGKAVEEPAGDDGYGGQDMVAKPTFKMEEQRDPLREALQQEAAALFEAGDYDEAGDKWYCLAEAANHAGDKNQECTAMQNMGTALVMMNQLAEACRCYSRGLQLAMEVNDVNAQVEVLESLAWTYTELGYGNRAVECMHWLRSLHDEGGNVEALCNTLSGLGMLHSAMAEWEEAAEQLAAALDLASEKLPDDKRFLAKVQSELGNVCTQLGDSEKGLSLYNAALELATAAEDNDRVMRTHGNMALALKVNGDLKGAAEHLAATIELAASLEDSFMEGRGCMDMADVMREEGNLSGAEEVLKRAHTLASGLDDSEACGECLTRLGSLALKQGTPDVAETHLRAAIAVWDARADELTRELLARRLELQLQASDDVERVAFYDEHADSYSLLVRALLNKGDDASIPAALLAADAYRAATLRELLALGSALPAGPLEELHAAPPLASLDEVSATLTNLGGGVAIYLLLLEDLEASTAAGSEAPVNTYCAWVIGADGSISFHEAPAKASDGRSVQLLAADLHDKMALSATSSLTRGVAPDKESLAQQREALVSRGVLDAAADPEAEADVSSELALLSEVLLAPLLPFLPEGCPVTLVPHASLHLIPFSALPAGDAGQPFVSQHALSQVPSLSALSKLAERDAVFAESSAAAPAPPLVIGAPTTLQSLDLRPLAAAATEAAQVAAQLGAPAELTLLGFEAKASAVLSLMQQTPLSLVHIAAPMRPRCVALSPLTAPPDPVAEAAEGGLQPEEVDTAETGAKEAEAGEQGPIAEGLLFMDALHEIALLGHPTIVLSGSHSAGGELSHEGLLSLPRAFIASGARSVLSSLWEVHDEPAALLASSFYSALLQTPGMSQAAALQQAVLELQAADGGKYAHPLYWAGFSLTGVATGV